MNIVIIVISLILGTAVLCGTGFLIGRKKAKGAVKVLVLTGAVLAESAAAFAVYVNIYYKADDTAVRYLSGETGDVKVTVSDVEEGWLFDGPGSSQALIFYPGGKVETEAYSPLLCRIAERGIDCYLVDMPMNLAFFDINAADSIISRKEYDNYCLAGHSLGGVAAAYYAADNSDKLDGLVLLAAYSTKPVSSSLPCLSVYGSCDGVLNMKKYRSCAENLPLGTRVMEIEGGNHCQFGSYGLQRGDGEASVSASEQWDMTADAVADLLFKKTA